MLKIVGLELLNKKVIDLEVYPGEVVILRGENGSGKSLFLQTLARLIPRLRGEVTLEKLHEGPIESWRSLVMYLPPEVSFDPSDSVDDFFKAPLKFNHYKNIKTSSFEKADFDFLRENSTTPMHLLSSGQRQQAALLRAMGLSAQVLLLDETFVHMDESTRGKMFSLLDLWLQNKKNIFIVSHFELGKTPFILREFIL